MIRFIGMIVFGLAMLASNPAGAGSFVIRVTGPDPVAAELASRLGAKRLPDVVVHRSGGPADLRIAVGTRDFRDALADPARTPVVGVAITRPAWLASTAGSQAKQTALFWEPDPVQHLRLARRLMPGARRAGIVLGMEDPVLLARLEREAQRLKMTLDVERISSGDALVRRLKSVLDRSDFLLGIEDPLVFSPATVKTVLLTSYRQNRPVVGPSPAYVEAGSVASLVVTLEDVADALADWLPALMERRDALPPPRHVDTPAVRVNARVAHSLQLSVPPQLSMPPHAPIPPEAEPGASTAPPGDPP